MTKLGSLWIKLLWAETDLPGKVDYRKKSLLLVFSLPFAKTLWYHNGLKRRTQSPQRNTYCAIGREGNCRVAVNKVTLTLIHTNWPLHPLVSTHTAHTLRLLYINSENNWYYVIALFTVTFAYLHYNKI